MVPELRLDGNTTIGIFSDYGGEHRESRFNTYSVLAFGWNHAYPVLDHILEIRNKHAVPESREMSFKRLGNGPLARCLPEYLNACDTIAGLLCTVAVHKSIPSVIGTNESTPITSMLEQYGFGKRKPKVAEKLLRVMHIAAYLTAWLSGENQNVFWMSDDDEIVPNPERTQQSMNLFQSILQIYTHHELGQIHYTKPSLIQGPGRLLDFLSVADLAAGAVESYLSSEDATSNHKPKPAVENILGWLGRPGIGLKKHTIVIRPDGTNSIVSSEFKVSPIFPSETLFIPVGVKRPT